jgi:hypothetical protein
VTPVRSTNKSTGNPLYMSLALSPTAIVPTRNVITRATVPRLIGRRVPMRKTTTSPMTPTAWMDR